MGRITHMERMVLGRVPRFRQEPLLTVLSRGYQGQAPENRSKEYAMCNDANQEKLSRNCYEIAAPEIVKNCSVHCDRASGVRLCIAQDDAKSEFCEWHRDRSGNSRWGVRVPNEILALAPRRISDVDF